ncbi:MAG: SDR family oxidoreductase [Deferrisomatales bacterium]
MSDALKGSWALILGASSGFGAATARTLARKGMHVCGVHMDRKATLPQVERLVEELQQLGARTLFFNVNAADPHKRRSVLDELGAAVGGGPKVRVLLHSLAFGTLKPYVGAGGQTITPAQMDMTLDVMAHSLVYWVQDLVARELFDDNSRIFAMTSSGGTRVWPNYGAVSAAKAALESHIRQLALELAPRGVTANAVRAGVTDTAALRKIPGHEAMIETAKARNPSGRLTTPEDVAEAVGCFAEPGCYWLTGNVLGVDGGEDITG